MYAAGGAVAGAAGAAFVATKNTGARAVGATSAAVTPSSTGSGSSNLKEKSHEDLQAEVKKLQAQVDTLQKNGSDGGIPIQIVAAICFGVFAFTYLFL